MSLDEKINNFSAAVLAEANKKRAAIEAENEEIKNKKTDKAQNEFLNDAFCKIQDSIVEIRKLDNDRVLQAQVNARRELFVKRDEIIKEVFDKISEKVCEFMKTDDYEKWLEKKITQTVSSLGNGDKTIFVLDVDLKTAERIVESLDKNSGEINVMASNEEDFTGGVSVINNTRNILIDNSFKELINSRKSEFLQKSGLTIE